MPETTVDLTNTKFPNNRTDLRRFIIECFLNEPPGTGNGENTQKYRYNIKKFANDRILYLDRPAYKNKGMDFLIRVENYQFRGKGRGIKVDAPRQDEIVEDLCKKKRYNPKQYEILKAEVDKIFRCSPYCSTMLGFSNIGIPIDILLESIRWLFVEQDVTYWHASGRNMLMDAINLIQ